LLDICETIDGIHIFLASFPNKRVTLATNHFFNRKKIHSIVMQANCNANNFFGMFMLANLVESMIMGNSRCLMFTNNLGIMRCAPYIIGDVA
jgi:hypothetical protein